MAKKNKFKENTPKDIEEKVSILKDPRVHLIIGFMTISLSIFLLISLMSHLFNGVNDQPIIENIISSRFRNIGSLKVANHLGIIGALSSFFLFGKYFGIASLALPLFLYCMGHRIVFKKSIVNLFKAFNITIFLILWTNVFAVTYNNTFSRWNIDPQYIGGVGYELTNIFYHYIGMGLWILLIFSLLIFLILGLNITSFRIPRVNFKSLIPGFLNRKKQNDTSKDEDETSDDEPLVEENNIIDLDSEVIDEEIFQDPKPDLDFEVEDTLHNSESQESDLQEITRVETPNENYDPKLDLSRYIYPDLELLHSHDRGNAKVTKEELELNKNKIVETLINFKIGISSIKATIGPTVTLYEIIPEAGIKISKIKSLEDDIALSLSALGIRIIAPIPGKGTIGIEVPNKQREVVSFKSIIGSEVFNDSKMDLPLILGKTVSNENYIADLTQMPHLLIAGATGQGKSVGLNVILASLLYKKHPSQLKFVLVDPKKVELSLFSKIERHFLAKLPSSEESIITETKEVVHTLNSLCIEMDTRYELLKEAGTRNIKEYNTKFVNRKLNPEQGHRFLPYIVLVIDEFADMMMTAGKEIETPVARLAQLARAIGIHLVLATQRPSVNVITGIIKANFPVRISYKVSSKIDSRTILDAGGADQLVGRGDLLLSSNSKIIRLQCPFVDTPEIDNICDHIGSQQGYATAYNLPEYESDVDPSGNSKDLGERDSMFEEAARLVVSHQQGSTSLIQRRLKLGYNRSGRLIDQLESAGVVGPFEGSRARAVLIPDEASLQLLLDSIPKSQ